MLPKLMTELAAECIECDPIDATGECMFGINSLMQYRNSSPYECLFGANPNPIFEEETDFVSANIDDIAGFYEHHQIRTKAIQVFQETLLQQRLERVIDARPRTDLQQSFRIGQWIDIYRKPKQKGLHGWRGPAVVLSFLGEGYLTCRWQSICVDVPINHCRPHIVLSPNAALNNSGPAPLRIVPPADGAVVVAPPAPQVPAETVATHVCSDRNEWEQYWQVEATDEEMLLHDSTQPLVSIVAGLPVGELMLHAVILRQNHVQSSQAALRDGHQIFNLGKQWAHSRGIVNYVGLILSSGRRYIQQHAGVCRVHATFWLGNLADATMQYAVLEGDKTIDWFKHGIAPDQLHHLRVMLLLEGNETAGPPLTELLKQSGNDAEIALVPQFAQTGRIRDYP